MRLSIIIAMYNAEAYIEKCLLSAINHNISSEDYEIIVVDDGSSDSSNQLVTRFIKKNSDINIRLLSKKNGGQGSARNMALNIALGKYILFLDSDDWIESNNLIKVLFKAESLELDILSFGFNKIDENGKLLKSEKFYKISNKIVSGIQFMYENTLSGAMCLYLYSNELIRKHQLRFIEGIFHEDEEYIVQAFSHAERVMHCDITLYNYFIRTNSTMHKKDISHRIKLLEDIILIIKRFLEKKNLSKNRYLKKALSKKNNQLSVSLLLRLINGQYPKYVVDHVLTELRGMGLYPCLLYGLSMKSKLFAIMMNNEYILRIALKMKL